MNNPAPRTIRIDDGWSIPATDGVHRRTLVKGTAWTVPVVAISLATPAAAASGTPTLKFTQSSYSGKACETITGVRVERTTDGTTADPGKTITVTLTDGYTFKDGTTTYSGATGSDGLLSLPDITVPAKGGKSAFAASSSEGLSAAAPVSGTSRPSAFRRDGDGNLTTYEKVPYGAKAVGDGAFLSSDGNVYQGNDIVAKDVDKVHWTYNRFGEAAGYDIFSWVSGTTGYRQDANGNLSKHTVPDNSTAIGDAVYLAPNGDVYNGSTKVLEKTTSIHWYFNQANSSTANQNIFTYVKGGVAYRRDGDGNVTTYDKVPSDAKAVGDGAFLSSDGNVYQGNDIVAKDVDKVHWTYNRFGDAAGYDIFSWVSGTTGNRQDANGNLSKHTVPDNSTAIGDAVYLAPNGDVYNGSTKLLEKTTSIHWYFNQANSSTANQNVFTYTNEPTCS
ncbi:hypothetical protein C5D07_03525 [Rathayibacter tritici]|uniref:hypothetical protein n=1 Tax=Rathayibacter tritici TaxID=33888 RepID=UPI000CE7CA65|nr:hypothetical protein [Rathayibacter tritici]PPI18326.1 hypothetical protein C5D07_03525 [Rathayibacter tritici]